MRKTSISVAAPKCTVCDKSVYDMEKVTAIGQIWHKTCFTCGGKGTDGACKRVLTLDKYLDHGTDPFCKTCHGKLFGPKGYGYGVGAGVLSCHEERPSSSSSSAATVAPVVLPSTESSKEYDEGMLLSARSEHPPPPPLPTSNSKKQKPDDSTVLASVAETETAEVEMNVSSAADDESPVSPRSGDYAMAMSPAPIASPRAEPMETVTEDEVIEEDMGGESLEEAARAALLAKSTKQEPIQNDEEEDDVEVVAEEEPIANEALEAEAEPTIEESTSVLVESAKAPAARPPPPPPPVAPVVAQAPVYEEQEQAIVEEEISVEEVAAAASAVLEEQQQQQQVEEQTPMVEETVVVEEPLPPAAPIAVAAPVVVPPPAPVPARPAAPEISPRIPSPDRFITSVRAPSPGRSKSPARDAAEIVGVTKKSAAVSKFGSGAPKCSVCQKAVYPAEKVQAIDQIWHKTCFCCGGNSNDGGCKKVLTLDKYVSHGNDPFCKPCHGKLFGPKGYGYGAGAGVLSSYEQKK